MSHPTTFTGYGTTFARFSQHSSPPPSWVIPGPGVFHQPATHPQLYYLIDLLGYDRRSEAPRVAGSETTRPRLAGGYSRHEGRGEHTVGTRSGMNVVVMSW